jgi:proteasome lid subunit RPN8/RPN11
VVISQAQWDQLVAHTREESPKECCGWMRLRDGAVEEVVRGENHIETSPLYGYRLDARSLFAAYEAEEEGFEIAVYHSHPRSPAEPSQTDINVAPQDLNWGYVIVSGTEEPAVRAWRIDDGRVEEEDVSVQG